MSIQVDTFTLAAGGIGGVIFGSQGLAEGHVSDGAKAIFCGMTSANIGGRLYGLDSESHSNLMKSFLFAGPAAISFRGLRLACNNPNEFKGIVQVIAGIAGALCVNSLDAKLIVVAHQALGIALGGFYTAKLGFRDLEKKCYLQGVCKILLGMGGMGGAAYYAYSTLSAHDNISFQGTGLEEMPHVQLEFLKSQQKEIEQIYASKEAAGNWKDLGNGVWKKAFIHDEFPDMLIKIPKSDWGVYHKQLNDNHAKLESIRDLAAGYDRIVLPKSYLYETSQGAMLVEQRLHFDKDFWSPGSLGNEKEETMGQFDKFKKAANLCDLEPTRNHNSGIILGSNQSKIGIIDFDCNSTDMNLAAGFVASVIGGAANFAHACFMSGNISQIDSSRAFKTLLGIGMVYLLILAEEENDPIKQVALIAATLFTLIVPEMVVKTFNQIRSLKQSSYFED